MLFRSNGQSSFLPPYRRCHNVPTWIDLYHDHIEWIQGPHGRSIHFSYFNRVTTYLPFDNPHYITTIGIYSEHAIPVDIADRFNASFPFHMSIGLSQRSTAKIAELDK